MQLIIPEKYKALLSVQETEKAIKKIKDYFQLNLSLELNLRRVTAPMFVEAGTGINDDLNGVEKPVAFQIKNLNGTTAEIVQSLAKWKRLMLGELGMSQGEGLYTDMNAIRPDDILDNLHSLYVDQWDWERVMNAEERTGDFLKNIVRKIYGTIRRTELLMAREYPHITPILPEEITFIHSEEMRKRYPDITPKEREDAVCREYGAVFINGIGAPLGDGKPHDGRAPDYDDWITENGEGQGLNGDIVVWYPVLNRSFELSSMGIRVDRDSLLKQLDATGTTERKQLLFHQKLLNNQLPLSIGGGIGQSRLCTFFLRKAHIGEVQSSIWPRDMINKCRENNIHLL